MSVVLNALPALGLLVLVLTGLYAAYLYRRRVAETHSLPYRISFHDYNGVWTGGDSAHCGPSPITIDTKYGKDGVIFTEELVKGLIPVSMRGEHVGLYAVERGPIAVKGFKCLFLELKFVCLAEPTLKIKMKRPLVS